MRNFCKTWNHINFSKFWSQPKKKVKFFLGIFVPSSLSYITAFSLSSIWDIYGSASDIGQYVRFQLKNFGPLPPPKKKKCYKCFGAYASQGINRKMSLDSFIVIFVPSCLNRLTTFSLFSIWDIYGSTLDNEHYIKLHLKCFAPKEVIIALALMHPKASSLWQMFYSPLYGKSLVYSYVTLYQNLYADNFIVW
jgi:hypothetical protein